MKVETSHTPCQPSLNDALKVLSTHDILCDSLNIPVYIVDGVEMQSLDGIAPDEIVSMEVIKDPQIKRLFKPRLGGIVLIKTKSRTNLQKILQDYDERTAEKENKRIPGQLLIR